MWVYTKKWLSTKQGNHLQNIMRITGRRVSGGHPLCADRSGAETEPQVQRRYALNKKCQGLLPPNRFYNADNRVLLAGGKRLAPTGAERRLNLRFSDAIRSVKKAKGFCP